MAYADVPYVLILYPIWGGVRMRMQDVFEVCTGRTSWSRMPVRDLRLAANGRGHVCVSRGTAVERTKGAAVDSHESQSSENAYASALGLHFAGSIRN